MADNRKAVECRESIEPEAIIRLVSAGARGLAIGQDCLEDVIQEATVAAWQAVERVRPRNAEAYVRSSARRLLLDALRRHRRGGTPGTWTMLTANYPAPATSEDVVALLRVWIDELEARRRLGLIARLPVSPDRLASWSRQPPTGKALLQRLRETLAILTGESAPAKKAGSFRPGGGVGGLRRPPRETRGKTPGKSRLRLQGYDFSKKVAEKVPPFTPIPVEPHATGGVHDGDRRAKPQDQSTRDPRRRRRRAG